MARDVEISGVIVRLTPVGEADLILGMIAADRGRIEAWVRSGRKSSRRFGGRLELFRQGSARLREGKGRLPDLVAFEAERSLLRAEAGYVRLCLASYAAELAQTATWPEHADPELHAWLVAGLRAIDGCSDAELKVTRFALEIGFLAASGWLPDMATCVCCGGATAVGGAWPVAAEGPQCVDCAPGGHVTLSGDGLSLIVGLGRPDVQPALAARIPPADRPLLRARIDGLMSEALPRRPRTLTALRDAMG